MNYNSSGGIVALRGGYRLADGTMDCNYGTAGVGFYFGGFELGATYLMAGSNEPLNKTMMMTLGFKF